MDGNNINKLDDVLFTNNETEYLKKVYAKAPKGFIPKKQEAILARQRLNREILNRKIKFKKEDYADRGESFKAFMDAAEKNGYVNKLNYGLYATFYDVYDPNEPGMKSHMQEIIKNKPTKKKGHTKFDADTRAFFDIIKKCEASRKTLAARQDPNARNDLEKMINLKKKINRIK